MDEPALSSQVEGQTADKEAEKEGDGWVMDLSFHGPSRQAASLAPGTTAPAFVGTGAPPGAWRDARACIAALAGCVEEGLMILDGSGEVIFCNEAMVNILGVARGALEGMPSEKLLDLMGRLVPDAPPLVRARQLIPTEDRTVCEEFEIPGPPRSFVRWVAHGVTTPEPAVCVVCTDITAEVALAATHERDATTDRLTEVLNRRGIEPQLAREISLAFRHQTPLSLLVLDVDHFKQINDRHSHNVGDVVLRGICQVITRTIRTTDFVARWGGEEFLVLLPHTDLQQARKAGERVRSAIEAAALLEGHRVTISGGAAQFGLADNAAALIERADRQLYAAKTGGRNRIC